MGSWTMAMRHGWPTMAAMGDVESEPLVSIVTPTLNQGQFIEATINSIQAQTYRHFEHIVIDGGSTDDTLDILRRHEGSYPMRWLSEPDRGMYDAVNKGMRLASGEILAYLNSDDLYFPWTLSTVIEGFRRHPDAGLVYGDALKIENETGHQDFYLTPPFSLDWVQRVGFLVQPTVFWTRAVWDVVGPFDESLRYVADCDYWMRAGSRCRFAKINEFLAIERDHESSLRESARLGLSRELERVRSRYVVLSGPRHHRQRRLHDLSTRINRRLSWTLILLEISSLGPCGAVFGATCCDRERSRFGA